MLYFAYGSNLNIAQMQRRCPLAQPAGALILPEARLVFRGVADVEWHESESVQGGLWEITRQCERALDVYEGCAGGLYRKEYLQLSITRNGKANIEPCLIYLMNRSGYSKPSAGYFETIETGFEDFELDKSALFDAVEMFKRDKRKGKA